MNELAQNRIRLIVTPLLLVGLLAGCALYEDVDPVPDVPPKEQLTLLPQGKTMFIGESLQATMTTPDGSTVPPEEIEWTSGDENVVTIDKKGNLTAVGPGATNVDANWKGALKKIQVSVDLKVSDVTVKPDKVTLELQKTKQLDVTVTGPNDTDVTKHVSPDWISGDSKVATVDDNGVVKAVGGGKTTIEAVVKGKTGTAVVEASVPVKDLVASKETVEMGLDEETCVAATPLNIKDEPLSDRQVSWKSKDDAVAKVTSTTKQDAKLTAVGPGSTTLTATSEMQSSEITVDVSKWTDVAAGPQFSCALTEAGAGYCWGINGRGQLGDGSNKTRTRPVRLDPGSNRKELPPFSEVEAGLRTACAITKKQGMMDKAIYCWGSNQVGQLGIGGQPGGSKQVPTKVTTGNFVDLGAGYTHTCAVDDQGNAFCWGGNGCGQIGGGSPMGCGSNRIGASPSPTPVQGGHSFKSISAGERHTCGLTKQGKVYCWGQTIDGQLGVGHVEGVMPDPDGKMKKFFGKPTEPDWANANKGMASSGPTGPFKDVEAGRTHACAIDANDNLWCWGKNKNKQAGPNCADHTKTQSGGEMYDLCAVPSYVPFQGQPVDLIEGSNFMCLLDKSGTVHCWGRGGGAELGNGNTMDMAKPVSVGSKLENISSGGSHSCGIDNSGKVKCWGFNSSGQIGNGKMGGMEAALSPEPIQFEASCGG